jgi:hypothetical protein
MNVCRRLSLLCLLLAISGGALRAELVFASETLRHDAAFGEREFAGRFTFTNRGAEPVTILKTASSCGCTVPTLAKQVYAPGESGEILALFTYGSRTGMQRKDVTVTTSEGTHQLLLEVSIPLRWKLNQRLLRWNERNATAVQTLTVEFFHGLPTRLERIDINEERFAVESRWSADGTRLTLEIKPRALLEKSEMHRVELQLRNAAGEPLSVPFYLRLDV